MLAWWLDSSIQGVGLRYPASSLTLNPKCSLQYVSIFLMFQDNVQLSL